MLNFILPRENQGEREAHLLFVMLKVDQFDREKGTMASSGEGTMLSCTSVTKETTAIYEHPFINCMRCMDS